MDLSEIRPISSGMCRIGGMGCHQNLIGACPVWLCPVFLDIASVKIQPMNLAGHNELGRLRKEIEQLRMGGEILKKAAVFYNAISGAQVQVSPNANDGENGIRIYRGNAGMVRRTALG